MDGLVGVKSRIAEEQDLQFDGRAYHFGKEGQKDHIRILPGEIAGHAATRMTTRHAEKDGKQLPHLVGTRLFEIIPLEDALKAGAKLEENASVVAARQREADKEIIKKSLVGEVIEELKSQGWTPPRVKKEDK